MALPANSLYMFTSGVLHQIGPSDASERAYLESLIRADYERLHPGETLEDLKGRARFSKHDKGLLRDWMAAARRRIAARTIAKIPADLPAAE